MKSNDVFLSSHLYTCIRHGCLAAAVLFIHRCIFWNINVLFDGPLSISFLECFFTTLVCAFRLRSSNFSMVKMFQHGPIKSFRDQSLSIKLPIIFCLMIAFNNLCLYYMDIPMYFLSRSFAVPFSFILSYKCEAISKTWMLFTGTAMVFIGYIITLIEENQINLLISEGVIFGIFSALCVSLFVAESHLIEDTSPETQLKQVYVNNLISSVVLFVIVIFTESSEFRYIPFVFNLDALLFWVLLIVDCGISAFIGPLKLQLLTSCPTRIQRYFSVARSLLQTVIAVLAFHVYTTAVWWVGVVLVVIGFILYWSMYPKILEVTSRANCKEDTILLSTN